MLMQSLLHHIEVQKSIPKLAMNLWDMTCYIFKREIHQNLYYIYYKSILINKYIFAQPFKLTKAYLLASKPLKITRKLDDLKTKKNIKKLWKKKTLEKSEKQQLYLMM